MRRMSLALTEDVSASQGAYSPSVVQILAVLPCQAERKGRRGVWNRPAPGPRGGAR